MNNHNEELRVYYLLKHGGHWSEIIKPETRMQQDERGRTIHVCYTARQVLYEKLNQARLDKWIQIGSRLKPNDSIQDIDIEVINKT